MSTYVLMRILESAPRRYDLGIRVLTLGRLDGAYDRLAGHIGPGQRVLDLGCGTGPLTLRAARRGARVKGIDVSPRMLKIAQERVCDAVLADQVELAEMGVAELDTETSESYDVVTSGLCFSELTGDELMFALKHAVRVLRPGGVLLVADEVWPQTFIARLTRAVVRAPLVALTWLLTQQTTHPIPRLPEKLVTAGLSIVSLHTSVWSSLAEVVARKPT